MLGPTDKNTTGVVMQNDFDLFIVDLNGNLRGKRLLGSSLDKVYEEGVKLPRSVSGLDFWGGDVPENGLVFETGDNDGVCMPVQDKPVPVPWGGGERRGRRCPRTDGRRRKRSSSPGPSSQCECDD